MKKPTDISKLSIEMDDRNAWYIDVAKIIRDCLAITALIAGIVVVTLAYWGVLG